MLKTRIIPVLLLKDEGLYKTIKFRDHHYIGDPINCVHIFNEKEVDELIFLDITATREQKKIDFRLIKDIATECFMPFAYGGGVCDMQTVEKIFACGAEKIILNSALYEDHFLIEDIAKRFGTQSLVASIDAKKSLFGSYNLYSHGGMKKQNCDMKSFVKNLENRGVGEIMITSMDRDGTMKGYDLTLIHTISREVKIPVIACGGCGSLDHMKEALFEGGASAIGAGSIFVFHGKHKAVLMTYPSAMDLEKHNIP